ncbi:MAG: amidophosphoribosyltransferase [Clostridiales bacterium]|nr:amidophosphoribosyltransferase [Clostridiales bacterium]
MYLCDSKLPFDSFKEECGVFGIYSPDIYPIANSVYYGLFALQHRGQESCGIAVGSGNKIEYYKNLGLVPEVFSNGALSLLPEGNVAIGHVRYSTTGSNHQINSQPIFCMGKRGRMALSHNGNLVNARQLRKELIKQNAVFQTALDSEVIMLLINHYAENDIVEGVLEACKSLRGSYSFVLIAGGKLIAVRDPYGIRPLCFGTLGNKYVVASESVALDAVGASYVRDIEAGEVLVFDGTGIEFYRIDLPVERKAHCIFEHVYFARPDSELDGVSVYEARKLSGKILAEHYPVEADLVSGVPDSAVVAARGYSEASGIPYGEALTKNRYVGRTFIQPEQQLRESTVKIKLNVLRANVCGKRLVLIDDSIVRGTTSKKIVQMLKDAGAKEVHLRISSPIVKHPCYFGIDTNTYGQLVGAFRTEEEICKFIGADSLKFLTIDELLETVNGNEREYCLACFNGDYPYSVDDIQNEKYIFEK